MVATVRDWSDGKAYVHDLSGTDRRNPTVNGNGPLYGAPELSTDDFPVLDPKNNRASTFKAPVRDADTPTTHDDPLLAPSPYWGEERIWDSRAVAHNPMLDRSGRVWYTARIRAAENPPFCKHGSTLPSAMAFPIDQSQRQLAVYTPSSGKYTFVDTCFSTHHLQFAQDANDTLWTSGGQEVIGWLDTRTFDRIGDAAAAQGWSPFVLDTDGNGKLDAWVEPGQPIDPKRDLRLAVSIYAVMPSPADGSVWGSVAFRYPGAVLRFDPHTRPHAKSTMCRRPASVCAAPTSIAMAWSGSRWRAGIWGSSTGASAGVRSTVRPRPAITAPKAGPSIDCPVLVSSMCRK